MQEQNKKIKRKNGKNRLKKKLLNSVADFFMQGLENKELDCKNHINVTN